MTLPPQRCSACRGAWLSHGGLDLLLGRAGEAGLSPTGPSQRRCPDCTLSLSASALDGTALETCSTCRGVWLERSSILALNLTALEAPAPVVSDPPADAPLATRTDAFVCARCKKSRPYSDANGTAAGLVCGECTPQIRPISEVARDLDLDENPRYAVLRWFASLVKFLRLR